MSSIKVAAVQKAGLSARFEKHPPESFKNPDKESTEARDAGIKGPDRAGTLSPEQDGVVEISIEGRKKLVMERLMSTIVNDSPGPQKKQS